MTRIAERDSLGRIAALERRPIRERLLEHLMIDLASPPGPDDAPCWIWMTGHGRPARTYATIGSNGRNTTRKAHIVAYELWFGPVPSPLELDHLCRNRACCNPAHLEAVTRSVNSRRGEHRGGFKIGVGASDETRRRMSEGVKRAIARRRGVPWSADRSDR